MKSNLSYILLFIYIFYSQVNIAQEPEKKGVPKQFVSKNKKGEITSKNILKDSITTKNKDSIKKPKEAIDFIVTHNAEDYTVQNAKNKTVTLYNKGHLIYGDIDLKAGKITLNYKKNTVYATGIKDSTGTKYIQRPVFKQGEQESEQDSILFNFKSKKALVYGLKTIQGEMITYGEKTKRINDSTVYVRKIRFTTSKKKIPDYYIATNKAKLVPGKKIIVGGSQLVLADVPTPLYLPFAYFPLSDKRTSGFIIPTWGQNNQQGFFLQNGGYYFAINDYFDLEVTGDVYTNGSWALETNSSYYVRYKYSGNFRFSYQNLITSIRGFNDYSKNVIYNIIWNHNQDAKQSPNSRLSASVNLGSSRYYQDSYNERDLSQYLTNTLNSSIGYYKKFVGTPFSMNLNLSHSQNSNTKSIDMTLPSLNLDMEPIYPFVGKGGIKKNAIQKIGINYSLNGEYKIKTTDEDFFKSKMFKSASAGVRHNIRSNTNMKVLKYFTLSPNISYEDVWYFDKIRKHYDPNYINENGNLGKVINDTIGGFNRFNNYSGGMSLSTNIYGMFRFKKGRLKAIRHTLRPSLSWSYAPNLAKNHELTVQKSANPNDLMTYSAFEGGIYGAPSNNVSNSIGISIDNVLEAKVASKDSDSDEEDKKIMLLNNLNFRTSYNFVADSLRWSTVGFSTGTSFFKNKMSVNLSGNLDPYQVTSKGIRIDKINKNIFRLTNASLSANYSISSKDFEKKEKNDNQKSKNSSAPPDVYTTEINPNKGFANKVPQKQTEKNTEKETKLYHASVPWNISFVYAANYINNGYNLNEISNHTLGFSGNIELSPKWKVGFSSGYDIKNGAFSFTRLNFSRDLDSWRFNFNWTPFGDRTSYYFFIGVKSSMLSDLKWDKNKPPDRRLF